MNETSDFFDTKSYLEENAKDYISESGKYKLVVTSHNTKPGCWDYTKGKVYNVASGDLISEVRRNYHWFPFSFVENHSNGHDYLVCGENYQGQTVIELDTGNRRDYLPKAAESGCGFCWIYHKYNKEHNLLMVDGCYWGGDYEYKFFDFSDPMSGWKEIEVDFGECIDLEDGNYLQSSKRWPEIDGNIMKCYFPTYNDDDDVHDFDDNNPRIIITLEFQDKGLKVVNCWVSEQEKQNRKNREESRKKYDEWLESFKANDQLYLEQVKQSKDPIFTTSENYISVGQTYDGWLPNFSGKEKRICRRICYKQNSFTIDLEWAHLTGPIKLVIYKNGKDVEYKTFDHSIDGMQKAFEYAKEILMKG